VISSTTRLLVLGSFPGGASLAAGQYYAHPRNGFWPVVGAIFGLTLENITTASYQNRCAWLQNWRIGLWDVYAHCERQGSLDSAIRNAVLNDFASLKHRCPQLAAVAHNGAESFRHARAVQAVKARFPSGGGRLPSRARGAGRSGRARAPSAFHQPGQCFLELRAKA